MIAIHYQGLQWVTEPLEPFPLTESESEEVSARAAQILTLRKAFSHAPVIILFSLMGYLELLKLSKKCEPL